MLGPTIFRKVALDRLSSPEELDHVLNVTTPRSWIALSASLAVTFVALFWGVAGTVTTQVGGQGVIVRTGSILNIVAPGGGQVADLPVAVGDHVAAGDLVALVAQPALVEQIAVAKEKIAAAERAADRARTMATSEMRLQDEALKHQYANLEREIEALKAQAKLAEDQIRIDDQLLAKGLISEQQTYGNRVKLINLQNDRATLEARLKQLKTEEFQTGSKLALQSEQSRSTIDALKRDLASLEGELSVTSRVVSAVSGQVIELKVVTGATISAGTSILSLQPDSEELAVVVYVPASAAKSIQAGLEAQISPSTVKREEFGFIRGTVLHVADFPASQASAMRNFENPSLVQSLLGGGPVTEVRVALVLDPATPSGFAWSSGEGPNLRLSGGTLCTVQVTTREQRPISLVMPFVREKLGIY